MRNIIGLLLLLALIWLLNSGHYGLLFLFFGASSVALVAYIAHRMDIVDHETAPVHLSGGLVSYYAWLLRAIVLANLDVVGRIWLPGRTISPGTAWIKTGQQTDMGKVIYANSITLTPGTVTLDIRDDQLFIHSLTAEGLELLRNGDMDRRIAELEP